MASERVVWLGDFRASLSVHNIDFNDVIPGLLSIFAGRIIDRDPASTEHDVFRLGVEMADGIPDVPRDGVVFAMVPTDRVRNVVIVFPVAGAYDETGARRILMDAARTAGETIRLHRLAKKGLS